MNPASIKNMSPRDIPLEIARRAELRRRKRQREELGAAILEGIVIIALAVIYCAALKAFIR